jgi:hypothetical protein
MRLERTGEGKKFCNTYTTNITYEEKRNLFKPKIWLVYPTLTTTKAPSHTKTLKNHLRSIGITTLNQGW